MGWTVGYIGFGGVGWVCQSAAVNTKYTAPSGWVEEYLDFTITAFTATSSNHFSVFLANEYPGTPNTGFYWDCDGRTSTMYMMRNGSVRASWGFTKNFPGRSNDVPIAGDHLRLTVRSEPAATGGSPGLYLDMYVNDMTTVFQTFIGDYSSFVWLEAEHGNSGYIAAPAGTTISGGKFCYEVSGSGGGAWSPTTTYPATTLYPSTTLYPQGV